MARDGQDPFETNPSGDLLRGVDVAAVANAVKADRAALEPFRENRKLFAEQHVGSYYGTGGPGYEVPLPLISTFVSIHSRALVAKEPRTYLSTFDEKKAPAVDAMENWLNDYFQEIELGDTFRRVVSDALMSEGRIKVCLTAPELAESGYGGTAGEVGFYLIDEDDWVCDMRARTERDWAYCGHKYRIPLEVARDVLSKKLEPTEWSDYDEGGLEKILTLGSGPRKNRDEVEEYVDLWEIHLKRKGVVLTLRDNNGLPGDSKSDVLRVKKYLGPKSGNVFTLGYGTVPGNLRPLSPVMGLMPLHLAINRSYRKIIKTADNYKSVLMIRGQLMSSDGKQIKDASHGDIVACDDPQGSGEKRFNVPPAELQLLVQDMRSAFDYMGGGLATLGGRAAQAGTATQEKILNQNSHAGLADMQGTTVSFSARVIRCGVWYLWNHPEAVYETKKQIPGLDREYIRRELYPHNDELPGHRDLMEARELTREGPMPRIRVDPFSFAHTSPAERKQFISGIMAELAPYAAIMGQQGYFPDFGELLKLFAKYGDEPDLQKVYKFKGPPEPEGGGDGGESAGGLNKEVSATPPRTERVNTRVSQADPQAARQAEMIRGLSSAASAGNGTQGGM